MDNIDSRAFSLQLGGEITYPGVIPAKACPGENGGGLCCSVSSARSARDRLFSPREIPFYLPGPFRDFEDILFLLP
jgi:hypothetical protein